jgi:hypothetical protein
LYENDWRIKLERKETPASTNVWIDYWLLFSILVGSGAQKYAISKGIESRNLISEEKLKKWSAKKKKKETSDTIGSIMIYKNE